MDFHYPYKYPKKVSQKETKEIITQTFIKKDTSTTSSRWSTAVYPRRGAWCVLRNHWTAKKLIHLLRNVSRGKLLKIYKLRTMYPYSEYIQEYVYNRNHLASGGKIREDYRATTLGRFLRRYWLDELPSLWNWLRGDVKIVGVRPLSRHYFSLYSPELQQRRIGFKPGLIPPFYADLPESLEEIQASENRYLDAYEKAPLRTDLRYFRKAMYNILVKGAKSG